jgi:hypothetical protein
LTILLSATTYYNKSSPCCPLYDIILVS